MRKIALAGLLAREQVASSVQHAADFRVLFVSSVLSLAILRTWPTGAQRDVGIRTGGRGLATLA